MDRGHMIGIMRADGAWAGGMGIYCIPKWMWCGVVGWGHMTRHIQSITADTRKGKQGGDCDTEKKQRTHLITTQMRTEHGHIVIVTNDGHQQTKSSERDKKERQRISS